MSKMKNIINGIYCRLYTVTSTLKTKGKEQMKPKFSRREIRKIGQKITKMEISKTIKKISETRNWFFRKNKIDKLIVSSAVETLFPQRPNSKYFRFSRPTGKMEAIMQAHI